MFRFPKILPFLQAFTIAVLIQKSRKNPYGTIQKGYFPKVTMVNLPAQKSDRPHKKTHAKGNSGGDISNRDLNLIIASLEDSAGLNHKIIEEIKLIQNRIKCWFILEIVTKSILLLIGSGLVVICTIKLASFVGNGILALVMSVVGLALGLLILLNVQNKKLKLPYREGLFDLMRLGALWNSYWFQVMQTEITLIEALKSSQPDLKSLLENHVKTIHMINEQTIINLDEANEK